MTEVISVKYNELCDVDLSRVTLRMLLIECNAQYYTLYCLPESHLSRL